MNGKLTRFGPQLLAALVCLVWLGVGATFHHSNGASKRPSAAMVQWHPAGAQFVIADLDGDRKPDLALVEMGSPRSAKTNYSIRLQFSAGAESAIGINAPFGGLRVAARDVNGDDNIDLIVTSNLDARVIAILLNDGHGNFSVAAPGAYPELENESQALLNRPAGPVADQTTLVSLRSSFSEEGAPVYDCRTVLSSDSLPLTKNQTALPRVARSRSGRSPPVLVALS